MGVELNVDFAGSISELKEMMKDFALRIKLYRVLLRGKSLEFEGYRNFGSDDDASEIDWKASTRANKLLAKQYREEQELKIMFVIDVSEHMISGSTSKLKCEYLAEAAAALAHLILESGDKIGLIVYNENIKDVILPRRGNTHFQYFAEVLSDSSTYGGRSHIESALDFLADYVDASVKGVVFMSDFTRMPQEIQNRLDMIGRKFETFAIMVKDPLDRELPDVNAEVAVEDPATGQQIIVNPHIAKDFYAKYTKAEDERVSGMFKHAGIDLLSLSTDKPFASMLANFLSERVERKGKI
jgi:uncharacterized protein (DUF58 family)